LVRSSSMAECDPQQDAATAGDADIANATCGPKSRQGSVTNAPTPQATTMQVFIDPRTGEITKPPAGERSAAGMQETQGAISTSAEGLTETLSPVPGGGTVIDLQGRFNRPVTTTQGADGKISPHSTAPSPEIGGKR
jgi:hypothetical protein